MVKELVGFKVRLATCKRLTNTTFTRTKPQNVIYMVSSLILQNKNCLSYKFAIRSPVIQRV